MSTINTPAASSGVDVRGPRFTAWITAAVLEIVLIISVFSPPAAAAVLGVQAAIFAVGAVGGPRVHPYGRVFATVVAPRLGPTKEREPVPPLKFAQFVGSSSRSAASPDSPPALPWSVSSPPRAHWWPHSSTQPSASAWAVSSTRWSRACDAPPLNPVQQ